MDSTINYYRFQLGDFHCISLLDGEMDYELEAMVKNVPRADVEAALQTHNMPMNVITTPYANLLVDTGRHRVLVDMGAGNLADTTGKLMPNLRSAGIELESIDSIFITHAHPDHIGGALNDQGDPAFSKAAHYISRTEWNYWFSAQAETQAPEWMTGFARKYLSPLKNSIVLVDEEGEVLPGVSVLFAPGHTPGHMVVSFACGEERLLYTGDTVLLPLHLEHPEWLPVFDILADQSETSKRRIFDLTSSTGSWVLGHHFPPFPSLGHVIKAGGGWEWQPVVVKTEVR